MIHIVLQSGEKPKDFKDGACIKDGLSGAMKIEKRFKDQMYKRTVETTRAGQK